MRLKVKSQIWDQEAIKKGILDDCGPASIAACIGWATEYRIEPSVEQAVHAYEKINGRIDKQGELSAGTTFAGNIKVARAFGVVGKWPKTWAQVVAAGKDGAAILLNVQAPKGYPPQAMSVWAKKHEKRKPGSTYGHYVAVAYCADHGWQVADPTMTGKGKEALGALISEADFKAMASGKGRSLASTCIIIPQPKLHLPDPTPVPVPTPVKPTPAPVVKFSPPVAPKPAVAPAKWTGLRGRLNWAVGRITNRIAK